MSHEILLRLLKLGANDEAFAVVGVVKTNGPTAVKPGNKAIIKADGTIEGWVGGHCTEQEIVQNAMASISDGSIRFLNLTTCHGGTMDVYIEPYLPKRKLVVIGHVPIAAALSKVAKVLGFSVVIIDRDVSKEKFPDADMVSKDLDYVSVNRQTYVVIATMGEFDQEYAEKLLESDTPYIGIVAGKKRASDILNYLRSKDIPEEKFSKIRSPAGIYIRAVTAEEIALSIMAEVIEVARTQDQHVREPLVATEEQVFDHAEKAQSVPSASVEVLVDPVCGMTVDSITSSFSSEINGQTVLFCCETCKEKFDEDPSRYLIESRTTQV